MKKRILFLTVLVMIFSLVLVACQQKAIEKLEVVEGLERTYFVGDTPDFTNVKVKVVYNDGSFDQVNYDALSFSEVDTKTPGTKDLVITYKNFSTTVKVTVKATATENEDEDTITIFGTSYDDNLSAFLAEQGNKTQFRGDTNNNYVVGSINPFRFTLKIDALDSDLNPVIIDAYESLSQVYLVEGETETLLEGEALSLYVSVNETAGNNSFDFTDEAVGKTFKLVTRPAEGENAESFAKSLYVDVVDAYNIYEAWELNIITNDTESLIGNQKDVKQIDVVTTFLHNNGLTRPENLKGVVLHKSFNVQISDLPAEYFYTLPTDVTYTYTDKSGQKKEAVWTAGSQFFYDITGVYNVKFTNESPEFSIHGNYFTIYSYDLPCVAPKGHGYNDNELSGAELIRFDVASDLLKLDKNPQFNHENYVANIGRLNLRDDDGSDDDNSGSMRHMLGLLAFKTLKCVSNFDQVNVYAFNISLHANRDCQTVNIHDCDFYNAWNNHILTWSDNNLDANGSTTIHEFHSHITVNVTGDTRIAKCGGPVIINMLHEPTQQHHSQSNVEINLAEGTTIYSYTTGQEAWYTAYSATDIAMMIKQLNGLIQLKGGSYLTTLPGNGDTQFFNMIMVNVPYLQNAADIFKGNDLDGSFTIGDNVLLDMNDTATGNYTDPIISAIASHKLLSKAPIFRSSNGTIVLGLMGGTTQGVNPFTQQAAVGTAVGTLNGMTLVIPDGLYELDPTNQTLPIKPAGDSIKDGEYLTLYYNSIGIVFGYNESDITEY